MPTNKKTTALKADLRAQMTKLRVAALANSPDAGLLAAKIFMEVINIPDGAVVSVFHSLPEEIDTAPLIEALNAKAVPICLPVVIARKEPLEFRAYKPGDKLVEGVYGVKTPGKTAAVVTPDIVVAPLLAFSRTGGRLGYGGGYYDRTLAQLRKSQATLTVGYALAAQEVDALPLSPLDQPTDWVVTEREAIRCTG